MSNNETNLNEVMKQLESKVTKEAVDIVIKSEIKIATNPDKKQEIVNKTSNALLNAMSNGAKEFEQKVGRPMTYSEMRSMWG